MRGSVRKRGSTYSYWLDIGPDPVTGKRRQRTKGGFRTKRECQAALKRQSPRYGRGRWCSRRGGR